MEKARLSVITAAIVLLAVLLSSCQSGKNGLTGIESSVSFAEDSQQTSSKNYVTDPVLTTKAALSHIYAPTPTPMPTPTPISTPIPTPETTVKIPNYDFFYEMYPYGPLYIKIPMCAQIWETKADSEGSAADLPEKYIELPAGTILWRLAEDNPYISDTIMAFRTFDGNIAGINVTKSNDGTFLYDGHPLQDVFVMDETNLIESPEASSVDEIELPLWEMTDSSKYYHRLIVRVDWNWDGTEDELIINNEDALIVYTDGKTGEQTETNLYIKKLWMYDFEKAILCRNSKGDYAILIQGGLVNGSEPSIRYVITYDPDSMISNVDYQGYINYRDGQFYEISDSRFLGNSYFLENPVQLNDDFSFSVNSDISNYVGGWIIFSYTLTHVNIDVWNGSQYTKDVLPPGTAVIPVKTVIDSSGNGFLYVSLADGREARMIITYLNDDSHSYLLINGKDQNELFNCIWGG